MHNGLRYEKIINTSEIDFFKNNNYFILTKPFSAGVAHPSHWHDYYEFEILLEGACLHSFGNSTHSLKRGSAYLITPIESHGIEFTSDSVVLNFRFNIDFFPSHIAEFISTLTNATAEFNEDEMKYITERIEKVYKEKFNSVFYLEITQSILTEIIILFFRKLSIEKTSQISMPLVQQATNYIKKNFRSDLSLKAISRELSVTPKHLGSVFKQKMNINFNDYLNNLRLNYACNLLLSSDLSIKEIAYNSGYNSEQYFIYIFKKYIRLTPSEYKNLSSSLPKAHM